MVKYTSSILEIVKKIKLHVIVLYLLAIGMIRLFTIGDSVFLPLIFCILSGFANALTIVCTEYLETIGATWYQCWLAQFTGCAALVTWY